MSFTKHQKGIVPLALLSLAFLVISLTGTTFIASNPNARITINSWAKAKVKTWRDIGSPGAGRHAGKLAEEARVQIETQRAVAGITRPCQSGCTPEQIRIDAAGAGILGGDNGLGGISGFYLHKGKYYPIGEEAGGPSTESLQYIVVRIENPPKPEEKEPEKPAEEKPSTKPEASTNPIKSTAPSIKPKASIKPAPSTAPSIKPAASTHPTESTAPSTQPIRSTQPSRTTAPQQSSSSNSNRNNGFIYYSQRDATWDGIPTVGKATIANSGCGIIAGAMVTGEDPYGYWNDFSSYFRSIGQERRISTGGTAFSDHVAVLNSLGYKTIPVSGSLADIKTQIENYSNAGTPVWVNAEIWNGSRWIGHHTVAVGIDTDNSIIFNDPWYGEGVSIPDYRIDEGNDDGDPGWIIYAVTK